MGGDAEAAQRMGQTAGHYLSAVKDLSTDSLEYERAFYETALALKEVEEQAERRADAAEIMVTFLETLRDEVVSAIQNIEYAIKNGLISLEDATALGFDSVEDLVDHWGGEIDDFVENLEKNLTIYAGTLYGGLITTNQALFDKIKESETGLYGALFNHTDKLYKEIRIAQTGLFSGLTTSTGALVANILGTQKTFFDNFDTAAKGWDAIFKGIGTGWTGIFAKLHAFFDVTKWVNPINALIDPITSMRDALIMYLRAQYDLGMAQLYPGMTKEERAMKAVVGHAVETRMHGYDTWDARIITAYMKDKGQYKSIIEWAEALVKAGKIPGYASGGHFSGGLMMTGERGPELIHSSVPGYVYNANDTKEILGGKETANEIRKLRGDVISLKEKLSEIATNTGVSAESLESIEMEGLKVSGGASI
jgi:hypothetical protein